MGSEDAHLIVFSRYPVPGATKTRLIPALGPQGASDLQHVMTMLCMMAARLASITVPCSLEVRSTGGSLAAMRRWLGRDLTVRSQGTGDLGNRMLQALRQAFTEGRSAAVIVGTDCPFVDESHLVEALGALHEHDMVIGPAEDGGYYLIGFAANTAPDILKTMFSGIHWGTNTVFQRTMDAASVNGLKVHVLDRFADIDRPPDLRSWKTALALRRQQFAATSPLSVIVPTLNEGTTVLPVIAAIKAGGPCDVIVADGGSNDATAERVRTAGATVVTAPGGRADQQNKGADRATGALLLFLHADTRPPAYFDIHIRHTLSQPGVSAGAFRFKTDSTASTMRLLEAIVNWRSTRRQLPYGDQGLFLTRKTFEQVGGFPPLPIMEDYALVRRLRTAGRLVTASAPAVTSARRWEQLGLVRTTLTNQLMIAGYHMQIPPHLLAAFYRNRQK